MIALILTSLFAGQQAAPTPATATKQHCRVETVTGSLAQRTRTCHTEAEWRSIDDAGNKTGQQMIERGQQTCGECTRGG